MSILQKFLRITCGLLIMLCYMNSHQVIAQMNLTRELINYKKFIETGENLYKAYKTVDDIKEKSQFFQNAAYKVRLLEPIDIMSGTIVSQQAKVLYDEIGKTVNEYDLPEIDPIQINGPSGNSREALNYFLNQYTETVIHHHGKLKYYLQKQKEIDLLESKIRELKIENKSASNLYKDLLQGPVLAVQYEAFFNDWYNFEITFSKAIGKMLSVVKEKKKKWEQNLFQRNKEFENLKYNLIQSLQIQKSNLQEAIDEAEEKIKNFEENIRTLNEKLEYLESLKVEIIKLNLDIENFQIQLQNYRTSLQDYQSQKNYQSGQIVYYNSDGYKRTYNACPNKYDYWNCKHDLLKAFENRRLNKISKARDRISRIQAGIDRLIASIQNKEKDILLAKEIIQKFETELLELPRIEKLLDTTNSEMEEYFERIDIFYIFQLKDNNERNLELVINLNDVI